MVGWRIAIKAKQIILLNMRNYIPRPRNLLKVSKELVVFVDETSPKFLLSQRLKEKILLKVQNKSAGIDQL